MGKILIVDDDPSMYKMYKRLFTYNGYGVEVAIDGEDGYKKIHVNTPDLIILDVMMPKMNGLEFLKKIKENPKTKPIPVILLTNLGVEEELKNALSLGALGYVIKSDHEPSEVLKLVKKIILEAEKT